MKTTMNDSMILETLDRMKSDQYLAEMEIYANLIDCYAHAALIVETCNVKDYSEFQVFSESFVLEDSKFSNAMGNAKQAVRGKRMNPSL